MRLKWTPITIDFELTEMAIVTRKLKYPSILDVTIGNPGWGMQNRTIAYMPLPQNIDRDPTAWKSEYRGDELPDKDKACIVQLQNSVGKFKISESYYLAKENRFLRIPNGWEVIAWMEYPKPYKTS